MYEIFSFFFSLRYWNKSFGLMKILYRWIALLNFTSSDSEIMYFLNKCKTIIFSRCYSEISILNLNLSWSKILELIKTLLHSHVQFLSLNAAVSYLKKKKKIQPAWWGEGGKKSWIVSNPPLYPLPSQSRVVLRGNCNFPSKLLFFVATLIAKLYPPFTFISILLLYSAAGGVAVCRG